MAAIKLELKEITSVQVPVLLSVSCRHRKKRNHYPFDNPSIMEAMYISRMKKDLVSFSITATCTYSFRSAAEEAVMHNKSVVPSGSLLYNTPY